MPHGAKEPVALASLTCWPYSASNGPIVTSNDSPGFSSDGIVALLRPKTE